LASSAELANLPRNVRATPCGGSSRETQPRSRMETSRVPF